MAVWLRIPLVHPEAMDPETNGDNSNSSSNGSAKDIGGDGGATNPVPNGSNKDAPLGVDGAGGKEQAGAAARARGGGGARAAVEDPWETWNAVRVLCEHKSW